VAIAAVRGELTSEGMQCALADIQVALTILVNQYNYTYMLGENPTYVASLFDTMANLIGKKEEEQNDANS
jgi:hypothetical protein